MLNEKLSVGEIVSAAVQHALSNFGQAIKVSVAWIVTSFVVASLLIGATGLTLTPQGSLDMPGEAGLGTLILAVMSVFVVVVVASGCAVSWHRFVLYDEPPRLFPTLDRRTFAYAGMAMALMLIAGITLLLLGSLAGVLMPTINSTTVLVAAIAVYAGTALIVGRLILVLPAAAVDDTAMNLTESWRWSTGQSWRIFGCFLLASLVTAVPEWLLGQLVAALPILAIPGLLVMFALSALSFAIAIGVLSEIYRGLTSDISDPA